LVPPLKRSPPLQPTTPAHRTVQCRPRILGTEVREATNFPGPPRDPVPFRPSPSAPLEEARRPPPNRPIKERATPPRPEKKVLRRVPPALVHRRNPESETIIQSRTGPEAFHRDPTSPPNPPPADRKTLYQVQKRAGGGFPLSLDRVQTEVPEWKHGPGPRPAWRNGEGESNRARRGFFEEVFGVLGNSWRGKKSP